MYSRRQFFRFLLGGAGLLTGLASYGFVLEPGFRMSICRHPVSPTNWPKGMTLRIAALADPHIGEPYMSIERLEKIVEQTNNTKPDIVVLLGDYVAGHRFISRHLSVRSAARVFAKLRSPLGTYAILGNHDWWDDPVAQRTRQGPPLAQKDLEAEGIPVLENSALKLFHQGKPFWLLGLGDQYAFLDREKGYIGRDNLPKLMSQITDDAPSILLAHEPDIFPQVSSKIGVTLCGHTHGGQIRLFNYSPVVPSRYGNRYAYGHIIEDNKNLVVSGGLGCSILPVRFGVPPEITLIDLA
ncbi:metallophosphoesterase [Kiloniella majae]|uniref:metallophosphoesterase n=1 Tax=Kiloniella majae TaxID=1938558 RepID=UPI000A278ABE|nr:metallophosphoesterase [Kiloniella majae]